MRNSSRRSWPPCPRPAVARLVLMGSTRCFSRVPDGTRGGGARGRVQRSPPVRIPSVLLLATLIYGGGAGVAEALAGQIRRFPLLPLPHECRFPWSSRSISTMSRPPWWRPCCGRMRRVLRLSLPDRGRCRIATWCGRSRPHAGCRWCCCRCRRWADPGRGLQLAGRPARSRRNRWLRAPAVGGQIIRHFRDARALGRRAPGLRAGIAGLKPAAALVAALLLARCGATAGRRSRAGPGGIATWARAMGDRAQHAERQLWRQGADTGRCRSRHPVVAP